MIISKNLLPLFYPMIINRSLVGLTLLSPLLAMTYCLSSYSQTVSMPNNSVPGEQLPLKVSNGEINNSKILDPEKINSVQQVLDTLKSTGVSTETIAVDLVEAGADAGSVANLLINLNGLVGANNQVNSGQLNRAIASYNTLIDTSDLQTLTQLKAMPVFMDIRTLLQSF